MIVVDPSYEIQDVLDKASLVVRLEGTNVAKGRELIANSDLAVIPADNLNDAAQKIVAAVKG